MKLKEKILSALSDLSAEGISGEKLAQTFGVSRAAVWKAVKSLKNEGYVIEGEAGVGYRLIASPDLLTEAEICRKLNHKEMSVTCVKETFSTSTLARNAAAEGSGNALFVAERQTGGRGRLGRRFESPEGGIYMSFLLRPQKLSAEAALLVTTAACVAVCDAIRATCGIDAGIKWVNDIYVNGKKVCGILTEAVTCAETGELESVIIGIGINFSTPQEAFPVELRNIAGSLFDGITPVCTRASLAAAVADRLCDIETRCITADFLDEYRRRSIVTGKQVRCFRGSEEFTATAMGIDDRGGLIVKTDDGGTRTLSSGEITLRLNE